MLENFPVLYNTCYNITFSYLNSWILFSKYLLGLLISVFVFTSLVIQDQSHCLFLFQCLEEVVIGNERKGYFIFGTYIWRERLWFLFGTFWFPFSNTRREVQRGMSKYGLHHLESPLGSQSDLADSVKQGSTHELLSHHLNVLLGSSFCLA